MDLRQYASSFKAQGREKRISSCLQESVASGIEPYYNIIDENLEFPVILMKEFKQGRLEGRINSQISISVSDCDINNHLFSRRHTGNITLDTWISR